MKKTIVWILAVVLLLSACLVGCADPNNPNDPNNPSNSSNPNAANAVTGLAGAKLALANERMADRLIDNTDGIFAGAEEDMKAMAADGRSILQALSATVPLSDVTYTEDDIQTWSRHFTQFDETVRQSVETAERCAEYIQYMKESVRVVDTWAKDVTGTGGDLLLHVEENCDLLIAREDVFTFVCYRTRTEDGEEQYEILRKNHDGYQTRAVYVKNKRYEYMYQMPSGTDASKQSYLGFSAVNQNGRWECAELRYNVENEALGYPFDIWFVVVTDALCMGATQNSDDVRGISGVSISDRAHTADILNITINAEESTEYHFTLTLGAFSNYRGIKTGEAAALILADGTVVKHSETDANGVTLRDVHTWESVVGTEADLFLSVRAQSEEEAIQALLKTVQDWKLECVEPLDVIKENLISAKQIAEAVNEGFRWNGYGVRTNEDCYKAVAIEGENFQNLMVKIDEWASAPAIERDPSVRPDEQETPLISFGDLADVVVAHQIGEGSVSITAATARVNDLQLFEADEAYHLAFALQDASGLIHFEGIQTPTVTFASEAFVLNCGNVTLTLPEGVTGEFQLVMYVASSEGIRSTNVYKICTVNIP